MADFETSGISKDIEDIINSGPKTVSRDIRCILHTEKEDIELTRVKAIERIGDYANKIGETAEVTFWVPLGDYINNIYPYRTNLEFTVKKTKLDSANSQREKNTSISKTRYKAIFDIDANPPPGGHDVEAIDVQSLNTADVVTVRLHLVDRSLEPLRVKEVSGNFLAATVEQTMSTLMMKESSKVLVDGKPSIDGIDLYTPDNKDKVTTIILPSGTRLVNLPTYLQEKGPGVYNNGIGSYLSWYNGKKLWFVYPLFDIERFDKQKGKKLVIYAAPSTKYPQLDRTYQIVGDLISIVVTGNKSYRDGVDIDQMNEGSGFRLPDARAFMVKPVEVTATGITANRARLNHEVNFGNRTDGLNYAPMTTSGPSSNPYKHRSKVMQRNMGRVDMIWENGDVDLLYPGMPCKFTSLNQGKPVTVKGTLLFFHELTAPVEKNGTGGFRTNVRLTIMTKTRSDTPQGSTNDKSGGYDV